MNRSLHRPDTGEAGLLRIRKGFSTRESFKVIAGLPFELGACLATIDVQFDFWNF